MHFIVFLWLPDLKDGGKIEVQRVIWILFFLRDDVMERMQCDNCGYVYDKDQGDEKSGIAPGTEWKDVPADYKCPECGADKSKFIVE